MPAYNSASTIAESIRSVGMQTYKNWELIIVDDGSNDFTGEIINSFKSNDPRIILLKLSKNGGLPNARNEGCRLARGEFIVFLDSDDLWSKEKLENQLHFHAVNQGIEISHTDFQLFNEYGFIKRPFKYVVDLKRDKRGDIFPGICYKNPIGILTVMVKRTLLMEVNFFDSTLWTMEDHDLWVRIAKRGKDFGYVPQVLAYYRITPGSIVSKTGKYKKAYKVFIRKLLESNNILRLG